MLEKEITIKTGEGQLNTFIVHPDEDGPHPVILFLMDAPGKREELHQMARRIAACGYWVMLPNLYYRRVTEFVSDGTDGKIQYTVVSGVEKSCLSRRIVLVMRW